MIKLNTHYSVIFSYLHNIYKVKNNHLVIKKARITPKHEFRHILNNILHIISKIYRFI